MHDFAGAGADVHELGVAQVALGRVFPDITIAAEDLHGVVRGAHGRARGLPFGYRALARDALPGFGHVQHGKGVAQGDFDVAVHFGEFSLYELEFADGAAELGALGGVAQGGVERGAGDADAQERGEGALHIEGGHHAEEGHALGSEQAVFWHAAV